MPVYNQGAAVTGTVQVMYGTVQYRYSTSKLRYSTVQVQNIKWASIEQDVFRNNINVAIHLFVMIIAHIYFFDHDLEMNQLIAKH